MPGSISARGLGAGRFGQGLSVYFRRPPGRYVKFDGIEVKLEKPGFSFAAPCRCFPARSDGVADPSDRSSAVICTVDRQQRGRQT